MEEPKRGKSGQLEWVSVDLNRLRRFCKAFGGFYKVSESIGYSPDYLYRSLYKYENKLSTLTLVKLRNKHGIPPEYLVGKYSDEEFEEWLFEYATASKEEPKRENLCDEYCRDCVYSSEMSSPNLPMEIGCEYFYYEHEFRNCKPGTGCNKKRTGVFDRSALPRLY